MEYLDYIVFGLVGLGLLFAFIRIVKGPKISDRVVALDTFNVITVGLISLLSMIFDNPLYLDIAIVYGILAFIETVTFSRYMEGKYGNN